MNRTLVIACVIGACSLGVSASLINITPIAAGHIGYDTEFAFDNQPSSIDFAYNATKQIYPVVDGGHGGWAPNYVGNRASWFDFGADWQNIRISETWFAVNSWGGGTNYAPGNYPRVWWDDDNDNVSSDANAVASTLTFYNVASVKNIGEYQWVKDNDFTASQYTPQGRYLLVGSTDVTAFAAARVTEWVFVGEVVPEPLTLSLLAAGGIAAVLRRRR